MKQHGVEITHSQIVATLARLRQLRKVRDSGKYRQSSFTYTTSPSWLVNIAINRRAGWSDDPSLSRGSAMPVNGKYPKRAEGSRFMELWCIAHTINNTRVALHYPGLGSATDVIMARIPWRVFEVQNGRGSQPGIEVLMEWAIRRYTRAGQEARRSKCH